MYIFCKSIDIGNENWILMAFLHEQPRGDDGGAGVAEYGEGERVAEGAEVCGCRVQPHYCELARV